MLTSICLEGGQRGVLAFIFYMNGNIKMRCGTFFMRRAGRDAKRKIHIFLQLIGPEQQNPPQEPHIEPILT